MKYLLFALVVLSVVLGSFFLGWKTKPDNLGVIYSGQIGVYNSSGMTVESGNGSSIALDAYGRAKISTTTIISVITP